MCIERVASVRREGSRLADEQEEKTVGKRQIGRKPWTRVPERKNKDPFRIEWAHS